MRKVFTARRYETSDRNQVIFQAQRDGDTPYAQVSMGFRGSGAELISWAQVTREALVNLRVVLDELLGDWDDIR